MTAIIISLRVVGAGRRGRARLGRPPPVFDRPSREFDDASPHVAALEYTLGAVGGEVVNGLREFARRRRLPIDAVEALVTGELQDGLVYLEVLGETGRVKRISRIAIKVFVASVDDRATQALFDEMIERLPLVSTLREALNIDVELVLTS